MGKKKHQFIDKKAAHKFTLVHRSQRDPLQADDESSQHVLMSLDGASGSAPPVNQDNKKEEHYKFGVYFDDDYDYMQHLRPRGEGMLVYADESLNNTTEPHIHVKTSEKISFGNLLLPSEALPSKEEEKIGMLNKGVLPRGPQPDWDPEIVEALDEGLDLDDPDNILEDDFMSFANGDKQLDLTEKDYISEEEHNQEWETASENSEGSYIDSDNLLSDDEFDDDEEETKSRFTSYSMTSSIIRRTQGLKLLDDRFERIMEEYDEDEVGCIDHEEVTGNMDVNNEIVKQVVDEFITDQKLHGLNDLKEDEDENMENQHESSNSEDESDEKLFAQFEKTHKEKWDCESIISTYSNIYNHPKLIIEESKTKKFTLDKHTGIPSGVLKDTRKQNNKEHDDKVDNSEDHVLLNNVRNKNESLEEKKERKKNIKEGRKKRREEKKNNKLAFKNEYKKQEQVAKHTEAQKGIKM